MRTWWVGFVAALLTVSVYLGYRVFTLERRVDELARRLGATARPADGAAGGAPAVPTGDHEQRLVALERDQRALHDDLRTLEEATADSPLPHGPTGIDPATGEQRILSVVGRQQSKVLDRQLEFHYSRWVEQRQQALTSFAQAQRLSPRQTDVLNQLLEDELDGMVAILRRPDAGENPEKVADDWLAALSATDHEAHRILDPAQSNAWDIARFVERRILWPWLPDR